MKVSLPHPSNACCPQAFYTYGTYKEDGTPNFGLFCWFGFCWDGELGVMACIGGEKLTKDRIRATGRFSANLVTEELLPLANYFGVKSGYDPEIYICKIRNTLVEEQFAEKAMEDKGPMPVNALKPVVGWGGGTFFKVGEQIRLDA